jgi:hypothetical protein
MKIIDSNGKEITVTDLELAIMQADDYLHYRHANLAFKKLDEGLQAYWEDIYEKLLGLRKE